MAGGPLGRLRDVAAAARFALGGAAGAAVSCAVLWLLKGGAGLPLAAAGALAVEAALWSNFIAGDIFTPPESRQRRWTRALAFHLGWAPAWALNLGLLLLLVAWPGLHYLVANLVAAAAAAALSYGVSTLWTWRPPPPRARAASRAQAGGRTVVVVPTYNEAANVERLIDAVLEGGPSYEVLIVDDASPDGTGALVKAKAERETRVHLLSRAGKLGLGTAYIDGFRKAAGLGAELVIQMDCDLSHDPAALPLLVEAARGADLVIGSRYVAGGRTLGWPWYRRLVSAGTSLAFRALLGLPVRDATGGYKCWRWEVLETLPLEEVRSRGFAFQIEMNYLCWRQGYTISEVPVTFVNRQEGRSKMSLAIGLEAAALLWRLARATPPLR